MRLRLMKFQELCESRKLTYSECSSEVFLIQLQTKPRKAFVAVLDKGCSYCNRSWYACGGYHHYSSHSTCSPTRKMSEISIVTKPTFARARNIYLFNSFVYCMPNNIFFHITNVYLYKNHCLFDPYIVYTFRPLIRLR